MRLGTRLQHTVRLVAVFGQKEFGPRNGHKGRTERVEQHPPDRLGALGSEQKISGRPLQTAMVRYPPRIRRWYIHKLLRKSSTDPG